MGLLEAYQIQYSNLIVSTNICIDGKLNLNSELEPHSAEL